MAESRYSWEASVDVGLLVGILWILGQVFLVLGVLYLVVRVAVGHALKAHRRREVAAAEGTVSHS